MKRFLVFTLAALAVQVLVLIPLMVMVGAFGLGDFLLGPLFFYFPTILLIQETGNFTGCANMIQPVILGVPLGVLVYSILIGILIRWFYQLAQASRSRI